MKNKIFKLTALWMVVVGLAACQSNDVDVFGVCSDLAHKNMLGYYTFTEVDSATMQVFKKEYYIARNADGSQVGSYRESMAGQLAPTISETPITAWEAVMAENKLSMQVTVTLDGGETRLLAWYDNEMHYDGKIFIKNSISEIDAQFTIYEELANTEYSGTKKKYYEHKDTIKYMAWKTDLLYALPGDTAKVRDSLMAELTPYLDTIKWVVLNTSDLNGVIKYDSVTGDLTGLVDIATKPVSRTTDETIKGKHIVTYLTKVDTARTVILKLKDRPKEIQDGTAAFGTVGYTKTASYFYHKATWTEEYYTTPTSPKALHTDSTYTMEASEWVITVVSSKQKFDLLLKGKANGESEDSYVTLPMNGFDKAKGTFLIEELKYYLKQ